MLHRRTTSRATDCATNCSTIRPSWADPTDLLRTNAVAHQTAHPDGRSLLGSLRHDPVPIHRDGPSIPCRRAIPSRRGIDHHCLIPPTMDPQSGTLPPSATTQSRLPPTSPSGTEVVPTTDSGRGGGKTGVP